jgi:WD40 repeat protein
VTPDGQRAVSASSDQTLKVWDLASGRELRTLSDHSSDVYAVAVTPDGQRAVSASDDETVKVWDLASGRELHTLSGHPNSVDVVTVTPDGQRAVSSSWGGTLKVWDLASGRELHTLSGYTFGVTFTAVAVTPDGQRAVSASSGDQALNVWDLETGEVIATFTCDSAARCCSYYDALKLVVAGDDGGHVNFLSLEEPKRRA